MDAVTEDELRGREHYWAVRAERAEAEAARYRRRAEEGPFGHLHERELLHANSLLVGELILMRAKVAELQQYVYAGAALARVRALCADNMHTAMAHTILEELDDQPL